MRRILTFCCGAALAILARTEQLSMIVLNSETAPAGRPPQGWQIKVNRGTPNVAVVKEGDAGVLHLKSEQSSYALERSVDIDPAQFPWLTWRWKVTQLPAGGDFRHARTDDQAAQVLIAFADRRVLSYIWDTSAPQGTMQSASSLPLVHIFAVVCESGPQAVNRWLRENRDVRSDYEKAYGRTAPHVKGIRLQINSQHTGTSAESYFGEVAFRSTSG